MAYEFIQNNWIWLIISFLCYVAWIWFWVWLANWAKQQHYRRLKISCYVIASIVGILGLLFIFFLDPIDNAINPYGGKSQND